MVLITNNTDTMTRGAEVCVVSHSGTPMSRIEYWTAIAAIRAVITRNGRSRKTSVIDAPSRSATAWTCGYEHRSSAASRQEAPLARRTTVYARWVSTCNASAAKTAPTAMPMLVIERR